MFNKCKAAFRHKHDHGELARADVRASKTGAERLFRHEPLNFFESVGSDFSRKYVV